MLNLLVQLADFVLDLVIFFDSLFGTLNIERSFTSRLQNVQLLDLLLDRLDFLVVAFRQSD